MQSAWALRPLRVAPISQEKTQGLSTKSCHWKFLPDAARVQEWKLPALKMQISGHGFINITAESAFYTQFVNERILRRSFKGFAVNVFGRWKFPYTSHASHLKGLRLRKPFERIAYGMLFEHYFEHSSKWTKILCSTCESRRQRRKSIDFVGEVPTVFGFAVIISTVGSYQVRVCFINSSRLSLVSVACGSYRIIIISTGSL